MSKVIDYLALRLSVLGLLFVWSVYLFDEFISALLFTATGFVLFVIISEIAKRASSKTKYKREKLEFQMAVLGSGYALKIYKQLFPSASETYDGKCFASGDTLYFSAYKFFACSVEDVCQAFRLAREKGFEKIVVLCKSADRGAVKLSGSLGVKISFEKSRDIYKKLLKASLLPELTFEKKPEKFSLSDVLELVFQKQNIRYYLVTGLMLTLISLVSPAKTYYIVVGTFSLAMALICARRR